MRRLLGLRLRFIDDWGLVYWNPLISGVWLRSLVCRGLPFEWERELPVVYKGVGLECGYRLDFLVDGAVVVEIKAVDALAPSTRPRC